MMNLHTFSIATILVAASLGACSNKSPITAVREDTQKFTLPAGKDIEWKLRMSEGGQLEYSWTADQPVRFDFHSDHDDGTENFVSHKEGSLAADAGGFTAAFYGRHGWYWRNRTLDSVEITLKTKGSYEVIGRTGGSAP
jgi:hypothetical protein